MAGKTKWALGLTGLLTAYMFLYTTSLWLAGRGGAQALSPGQQELFYDLRQLLAAAGFLSFGLLGRLAREDRGRRVLAGLFLAGYGAGMVPLLAGADAGLTQAFSGAAVFCLGGLGGLVYWKMALSLAGSGVMGLVMGLACGAAYGLQFLCQLGEGTALLPAALAAAWGVVAVLLMRRPRPEAREEAQGAAPEKTGRAALVSAVVITLGLLVLDMLLDSQLARLQSAAGAAISQLPRLLLIPGSLLFGLAADRKQGRYLPLAVLCAMLVTLLIPTLLGSAENFQLNQCLFYVGVAATLSYYNLTFWRLAPGTARPELWASMGRVLDGTLGGLLGLAHFSGLPVGAVLVIDLAALGVVILTMTLNGDLALKSAAQESPKEAAPGWAAPPADRPEEVLDRVRTAYGLTDRETQVLREWLFTDDSQTKIAERMCISVSTLRGHVAALYRKTGVNSRGKLRQVAAARPEDKTAE